MEDTLFVVSNYKNNLAWLDDYPNPKIIYDKSNSLPDAENVVRVPNTGHNCYDINHFIFNNYDNLPKTVAFLQGWPFDHVGREFFDKNINNKYFTPLETYEHVAESHVHKKSEDGKYMEINSSWFLYLGEPYKNRGYISYDQFMSAAFSDYSHLDWIRFSPGAMYVVPRKNILYYSRDFYKKCMEMVNYAQYTCEAHLLERAMFYVFNNTYKEWIENE